MTHACDSAPLAHFRELHVYEQEDIPCSSENIPEMRASLGHAVNCLRCSVCLGNGDLTGFFSSRWLLLL